MTDIQFSTSDVSGMRYYQNFGCFSGIVPEISFLFVRFEFDAFSKWQVPNMSMLIFGDET